MTTKHPKPAPEWAMCEAIEPGKTAGGLIIPSQRVESGGMDMKMLVLLEASEGHYTGGAHVPCSIPVGSVLIVRGGAEVLGMHAAWKAPGDQRDLRAVHLRDVVSFTPPAGN